MLLLNFYISIKADINVDSQYYPYDSQSIVFTMASLENNWNLVTLITETYNQLNGIEYNATSADTSQTKLT